MAIYSYQMSTGKLIACMFLVFAESVAGRASAESSRSISPIQLQYESVFKTYRPYASQAVQSWTELNANVARAGLKDTPSENTDAEKSETGAPPANVHHMEHHGDAAQ